MNVELSPNFIGNVDKYTIHLPAIIFPMKVLILMIHLLSCGFLFCYLKLPKQTDMRWWMF